MTLFVVALSAAEGLKAFEHLWVILSKWLRKAHLLTLHIKTEGWVQSSSLQENNKYILEIRSKETLFYQCISLPNKSIYADIKYLKLCFLKGAYYAFWIVPFL